MPQGLLGKVFGERVSVWKRANETLLALGQLVRVHGHQSLYSFVDIRLIAVNSFLAKPILRTIHIASRDMREYSQLLAPFGQLQHAHAAIVVDLQRVLQWVIEIHRGRTIDDDVTIICDEFPVGICEAQPVDDQIALDRYDFADGILYKVFAFLLAPLEALAAKDLVLDPVNGLDLSFGTQKHVDSVDVWTRAQQLLQDDLAQEAGAAREQHVLVGIEAFDTYLAARHDDRNTNRICSSSFRI